MLSVTTSEIGSGGLKSISKGVEKLPEIVGGADSKSRHARSSWLELDNNFPPI